MKFWFDTEFSDQNRTIDLISIGIVSEDNREYYAISNEFEPENVEPWIAKNILPSLDSPSTWKSCETIRSEIIEFVGDNKPEFWVYNGAYDWVIFCHIFGSMRDIPKSWPWYANDIKQLAYMYKITSLPAFSKNRHHALADAKWSKDAWEHIVVTSKHSESIYHS